MNKPRLRYSPFKGWLVPTQDGFVSVSGLRASTSSWSGSAGRHSHEEVPVFIIGGQCAAATAPLGLKDAQPLTWTGCGHEPSRSLSLKANHNLSLPHEGNIATLAFSRR